MLAGLILFFKVAKYVSRMIFEGGILGGAIKIWGNPYLNSTTILFDNELLHIPNLSKQ